MPLNKETKPKLSDDAYACMYLNKPNKVFKCRILEFDKDPNTYKMFKSIWYSGNDMNVRLKPFAYLRSLNPSIFLMDAQIEVRLTYKNLFLRKKSSRPRAALHLAGVEKGEVIPDSAAPKSDFLHCREQLVWPSVRIRDRTVKARKT